MGKVVERSDDTYHAFAALTQHQQPRETETAADVLPESEHPVVLASQRAPVQRLTGVVRAMRAGDRELALTDEEWQTLGLEEPPLDPDSSRSREHLAHALARSCMRVGLPHEAQACERAGEVEG